MDLAMSLDLYAPDAVVIQSTAHHPEPIRADVSNAADTCPLPPISADADLRQIPEMAIDVASVIAFAREVTAEAFRAAMILRCTAWHQVPAGTLPDNDTILAGMVGLYLPAWMRIRERALDGFQKSTGGLLLEQNISVKARAALEERARGAKRREDD